MPRSARKEELIIITYESGNEEYFLYGAQVQVIDDVEYWETADRNREAICELRQRLKQQEADNVELGKELRVESNKAFKLEGEVADLKIARDNCIETIHGQDIEIKKLREDLQAAEITIAEMTWRNKRKVANLKGQNTKLRKKYESQG